MSCFGRGSHHPIVMYNIRQQDIYVLGVLKCIATVITIRTYVTARSTVLPPTYEYSLSAW